MEITLILWNIPCLRGSGRQVVFSFAPALPEILVALRESF